MVTGLRIVDNSLLPPQFLEDYREKKEQVLCAVALTELFIAKLACALLSTAAQFCFSQMQKTSKPASVSEADLKVKDVISKSEQSVLAVSQNLEEAKQSAKAAEQNVGNLVSPPIGPQSAEALHPEPKTIDDPVVLSVKDRIKALQQQYKNDEVAKRNLAERPKVHQDTYDGEKMVDLFKKQNGKMDEMQWVALSKKFVEYINLNSQSIGLQNSIRILISNTTGYDFTHPTKESKQLLIQLISNFFALDSIPTQAREYIVFVIAEQMDIEFTQNLMSVYVESYLNKQTIPHETDNTLKFLIQKYSDFCHKHPDAVDKKQFLLAVAFQIRRVTIDQPWLADVIDRMLSKGLINKEDLKYCIDKTLELCNRDAKIPNQRMLFRQLVAGSETGTFDKMTFPSG